jgi:hypothetical protein
VGVEATLPNTSPWSRSMARSAIASPPSASITARSVAVRPGSCPVPRGRNGLSAVEYAVVRPVASARSASYVPRRARPHPNRRRTHEAWDENRYPARRKCRPLGPTEPLDEVHRPSSEGTFVFPPRIWPHSNRNGEANCRTRPRRRPSSRLSARPPSARFAYGGGHRTVPAR